MRKKFNTCLIFVILLVSGYLLFYHANDVMESVLFAFSIWQNNLFPSLFPFFVLANILIQYGFVSFLGDILNNFMMNFFNLKGECGFVLAMSMISGFPSGAKYTKNLYQDKIIDEKDANHLITFTHFSNPFFIIGTIGSLFLKNIKLGYLILIVHILTNFIIGIIFKNKTNKYKTLKKISIKKALGKMHRTRLKNNKTFSQIITSSINDALKTLLLMLGVISFFLIITTLIKEQLPLNDLDKTIISGILEMTQGIKFASILDISIKWKSVLMTMFISFGGFSVHMQVISILEDTKVRYKTFFIARILHAIISGSIIWFLLTIKSFI